MEWKRRWSYSVQRFAVHTIYHKYSGVCGGGLCSQEKFEHNYIMRCKCKAMHWKQYRRRHIQCIRMYTSLPSNVSMLHGCHNEGAALLLLQILACGDLDSQGHAAHEKGCSTKQGLTRFRFISVLLNRITRLSGELRAKPAETENMLQGVSAREEQHFQLPVDIQARRIISILNRNMIMITHIRKHGVRRVDVKSC